MMLRTGMKDPSVMMRIGMALYIISVLSTRFVHPTAVSPDLMDGANGLLFGLSIGFNLVAVRLNSRRSG
jgi:hypothetical protein